MGGVAAGAQDLELFSGKLPHACLPAWRALAAATVQISPPPLSTASLASIPVG